MTHKPQPSTLPEITAGKDGRREAEAYLERFEALIKAAGDPCGDLGRCAARLRKALSGDTDWYEYYGFFPKWRAKLDAELAWGEKRLATARVERVVGKVAA